MTPLPLFFKPAPNTGILDVICIPAPRTRLESRIHASLTTFLTIGVSGYQDLDQPPPHH